MAFEGITLVRCFVESIRRVLPALAKNLWHLFPLLLLLLVHIGTYYIVYIVYTPPPLSSSHRGRAPAVANARWDPQGASKNINMVQAWQGVFLLSKTISKIWGFYDPNSKTIGHRVICTREDIPIPSLATTYYVALQLHITRY